MADLDNKALACNAACPAVLQQLPGCQDCAAPSGCLPAQGAMQLHWLHSSTHTSHTFHASAAAMRMHCRSGKEKQVVAECCLNY